MNILVMPENIKTIRRLLVEHQWIKSELASLTTLWGAKPEDYATVRIELYSKLFRVKKELDGFTDEEIRIAQNWERLVEKARQAGCRSGGSLDPVEPEPKRQDDDELDWLRILLFLYLLSKDHPMQAFLSLSIGWAALLFDVDEAPTIENESTSCDTIPEQRRKLRPSI